MLSSSAAACSSKLKRRQNRLRSARPQALLMREPNGAWMTRCWSPVSSKKRSKITVSCVGSAPSAARAAARYSINWRAAAVGTGSCASSRACACGMPPSSSQAEMSARRRDTALDSSSVRPGASPNQNGMFGGWPWASCTNMRPVSTFRMRYEVLPSWKMSPGRLSKAKSSFTLPMRSASGVSSTSQSNWSGITPPEVTAASAAPRRARSRPCTPSRCSQAPRRPRRVV